MNQDVYYGYDTPQDPSFVDPVSGSANTWGRLAYAQIGCCYYYFTYQYSYTPAGRVAGQRLQYAAYDSADGGPAPLNLDAYYTWDNEGKMTAMEYPGKFSNGDNQPAYTYSYDPMGHLNGMTENFCTSSVGDTWPSCLSYNSGQAATANYGPAGEMTNLSYDSYHETRTYNSLLQMTRMTVPGVMDMQYQYSPTQNNGRITQSTDGILGETVNYTYDALNRLIGAAATNGAWGSSYTFDGFGNLTAKTPTAGSAPYFSALIDATTNRQFGQQYDANGNPAVNGAFPYDVENRMQQAPAAFGTFTYDHTGKRMFAGPPVGGGVGATSPCEIYFYGITGQRLATFSCTGNNLGTLNYQVKSWNVYFGSKLMRSAGKTIVTDRLGSVRANSGGERMQYFPYGEERTSTADGREKWGTYFRDGLGQDYADQRYYSPLSGSFWTPDPSGLAAVKYGKPLSWNRYMYGSGDPINRRDRTGLHVDDPDETGGGACQDANGDWEYCDGLDDGGGGSGDSNDDDSTADPPDEPGCTWDKPTNTYACQSPQGNSPTSSRLVGGSSIPIVDANALMPNGPQLTLPSQPPGPLQLNLAACVFSGGYWSNNLPAQPSPNTNGGSQTMIPTDTRNMPYSRGKNGQQGGYGNSQGAAGVTGGAEIVQFLSNVGACLQYVQH